MKFILFDIDGTLIDSGGAGIRSLNFAFEEMFSVQKAFKAISMAGKTDLQIIREGLEFHNIVYSDGIISEFCDTYIRHLKNNINSGKGYIKPGIEDAVTALTSRKEFVLGLLTGNIEEGACIKLDAFGLYSFFSVGAFGSDDEDRNNLLPIAVDKLHRQRSINVQFSDCVVIGDTPRDIDCAKPYGAFSIAVATGPYSLNALAGAGPDMVLEDLSNTDGLISALTKLI